MKGSKLDTYLKMDISNLLAKGDYKTLREMESYLNKMARQRISRLESSGVKLDNNIIQGYSTQDFTNSYLGRYKTKNVSASEYNKILAKNQNKMLRSISNAKHFLNLKTSNVKAYKNWRLTNKKVGLTFESEEESISFYNLYETLHELNPGVFECLNSKEEYHVVMAIAKKYNKKELKWKESNAYKTIRDYLKYKEPGSKEVQLYNEYFKKK